MEKIIQWLKQFYQAMLNFLRIGNKVDDPEPMSFPVLKLLLFLSVANGIILIASNLAALKIWNAWGIPVDAGIWLFPLSYVVGDLLVDIYGEKVSNLVAVFCSLFALIVAAVMYFAKVALPGFPGVDNSAFDIVQSATGRIFLASVAGFLISQLTNNRIFASMRRNDIQNEVSDEGDFHRREIISSAIARILDSLVFETLAFWGRVSPSDFITQVLFAYGVGLALEFVLSLGVKHIAINLRWRLCYTDGKNEL